ncbi:LysR family transcriptional regulator [Cohaesibacter gelatinilyticus]|nr:LysR family transcriptional regulator [Cohaesibacter gelatinilyticus]
MDTLIGMRTFCAVVEEESFVRAAAKLELSAALTSKYVAQLEERLQVRLLNRTTRSLAVTQEGQAYYERCSQIIDQFDEMENLIREQKGVPTGRLRISAPITLAEQHLAHATSRFMELYPDVSVELKLADRYINLVDEGYDLAIRMGTLEDSSLIARKLAPMRVSVVASPGYLAKHGTPEHPHDLAQHQCIHDTNYLGGKMWGFTENGKDFTVPINGRLTTNSILAVRAALLEDGGIGSVPRYVVKDDIKKGLLKEILPDYLRDGGAVYAVYPHNRHLAAKVRVYVEFIASYFANQKDWQ